MFLYAASTKRLDVAFVLDSSGSIGKENFRYMLDFTRDTVKKLDVGVDKDRVAVMTYERTPRIQISLNTYTNKYDLDYAISTIRYSGGATYTYRALEMAQNGVFARESGERPDAQNVIVILSDGRSSDIKKTLEQAQMCWKNGTNVVVLGIRGDDRSRVEFIGMASEPTQATFFDIAKFTQLGSVVENVSSLIQDGKF